MADIVQNKKWWKDYNWLLRGEEWSEAWGGSDMQFFGCLLPRLRRYIPTGTMLEIAPGHGRWTQYLMDYCTTYIGVDLDPDCIASCKKQFSGLNKCSFYNNDGKNLDFIEDGSLDFVFSFDSLVHVDTEVLTAYLQQLKTKLSPNGIGFFHHSNMKMYPEISNPHWRDRSVSHEVFRRICEQEGMSMVSQELINWGSAQLIDCFSVFTQTNSTHHKEFVLMENPNFMKEVHNLKFLSSVYRR